MGTSIHLFIEFDRWRIAPFGEQGGDVVPFSNGEFLIQNDYRLFDALAGARAHAASGGIQRPPLIPPRGIPRNASRAVLRRYVMLVDGEAKESVRRTPFENLLTIPIVRVPSRMLLPGSLHALQRGTFENAEDWWFEQKDAIVTINSDWHSAGWLFVDEMKDAIASHSIARAELGLDMSAVLIAAEFLESSLGKRSSRFVFWFDN
jgi:hypothetical protein